jgi:hypothetical protein
MRRIAPHQPSNSRVHLNTAIMSLGCILDRCISEPPGQQVEILTALSQTTEKKGGHTESAAGDDAAFFNAIKSLTADGYYTSRIGLVQELGYDGNTYLAAFTESRIPEH